MPPRKKPETDASTAVAQARLKKKLERTKEQIEAGLLDFRAFLESPDYFPQGCDLSPALWAIVDALDAKNDRIPEDVCRALFNCSPAELPGYQRVFGFGAGRRAGKTSRVLARRGVHLAWTVPLPNLEPGEVARVAIIAMDKDAASTCLDYVRGIIFGSSLLKASVVGDVHAEEPEEVGNKTGLVLRRPDGKLVDIVVRAASKGGSTVRSKTLVCVIIDEACFLQSDDGHKVNDEEIFSAAKGSILFNPGAQILIASSPWIEGEGLLERLISENWKNGTQGTTALVAARVPTKVMRPDFDPNGEEEARECSTEDGALKWRREIEAIPLSAGSTSFLSQTDLDVACALEIDTDEVIVTSGGADYAHSSDRSALAIVRRYFGGLFSPLHVEEKRSGTDVKPTEVYGAFALRAKGLGAHTVASDGHCKENVREVYERHGMTYKLSPSTDDVFLAGRNVFREGRVSFAMLSEADRELLRKQLGSVMLIPGPAGRMKVHLPRTSVKDIGNGKATSHCDLAVALMNALVEAGADKPELWVHDRENRAARHAREAADSTHAPPIGSLAWKKAYRNGGHASSGAFW